MANDAKPLEDLNAEAERAVEETSDYQSGFLIALRAASKRRM